MLRPNNNVKDYLEQTIEWNTSLYMVFVDFEKGFDSIDREMLWKILRHYGIPFKIVMMFQVLYGFQARVLHDGRIAEPFEMKTGVRQGCLLSPLFFLVALDWVTRQAYGENKTGIQFTMLMISYCSVRRLRMPVKSLRHFKTKLLKFG